MSYTIYNNTGTILTIIPSGKVDTVSSSLTLVGKDVYNYGTYYNQNLITLLSNSANITVRPPNAPIQGQLWYDTTYKKMKVYDGKFTSVGAATLAQSEPGGLSAGDLWFNPGTGVLNLYDGYEYRTISACGGGVTGPTGPSGPSGPTGGCGPIGPSGPVGGCGPMGPSGPAGGPSGVTGPTGASGPSGVTGPSGLSGPSGATGVTGPSGPTGAASTVSGPTGATGVTGPSGACGPTGATGACGPNGATGPSGPTGVSGPSGASGAMGVTGPVGPSGPSGTSITGPSGPSGVSGPQGPASSTTNGPVFVASQTTFQHLLTSPNSFTTLPLIYDSVSHSNKATYGSGTGIFTATQAGYYQVNASIGINPATLSDFTYQFGGAIVLLLNNSPITAGSFVQEAELISGKISTIVISQSSVSTIVYMANGDQLNCALIYTTNAPNNIVDTQTNLVPSTFNVCWIRGN